MVKAGVERGVVEARTAGVRGWKLKGGGCGVLLQKSVPKGGADRQNRLGEFLSSRPRFPHRNPFFPIPPRD